MWRIYICGKQFKNGVKFQPLAEGGTVKFEPKAYFSPSRAVGPWGKKYPWGYMPVG